MYDSLPKKLFSSLCVVGGFIVAMADALAGSTFIPRWYTKKPRNLPAETPKCTLERIHLELVQSASFEHFLQDTKMISPRLGLHHNIINIIFNFTMHHIMEHCCHGSLICGSGILESKWHDGVVEVPNRRAKCSFLIVPWRHKDLIITAKAIHKGKHCMTSS